MCVCMPEYVRRRSGRNTQNNLHILSDNHADWSVENGSTAAPRPGGEEN